MSASTKPRKGGRPYKMTPVKLRMEMASMARPETKVSTLCKELGITRQTLYRHVSPDGQLRADGIKLFNQE
ncbi:Hin recombinase [Vibrio mediterranei]|uniref:Hin recombinase n=1 Tax=Vibrio mediterranei TaxID=689 RepID=UPI0020A34CFD|nr:Hin recombinase [Vibrio mediterranei]